MCFNFASPNGFSSFNNIFCNIESFTKHMQSFTWGFQKQSPPQSDQMLLTVNSGSEMVQAKHFSGRNTFWSSLITKSREENFLGIPTLSFGGFCLHMANQNGRFGGTIFLMAPKAIQEFKNISSPTFACQSRPKSIFFRHMFCLYHSWARIHCTAMLTINRSFAPLWSKMRFIWQCKIHP